MRISVTPAGIDVENSRQIGRPPVALYLAEGAVGAKDELDAGSTADLERNLRESGHSYVVVEKGSIRIVADYQGSQHLYVHRAPAAPELTITDDPLTFAGVLPIDHDIARLVPLMKFVPPTLSIIHGAERLPPGTLRVYDRSTLMPIEQASFLPDLYRAAERSANHHGVRETLTAIVADQAQHVSSPVVFLSGGSDSALLVHLLKQSGATPTTWTAIFDTATGRSEGRLAATAAARYGVSWRSVSIDKAATLEHLSAILDCMKEPFADVALVPEAVLGLIMRREMGNPPGRIPVFEGEGMDSLMCGSYKFATERYRRWLLPALMAVPGAVVRGADRRTPWGALKLKIHQMKSLLEGGAVFQRHLRFLLDDDFSAYVGSATQDRVGEAFKACYDLLPELDGLSRLAMMTFQGNVPNLENRKLQVVSACAGIDVHLVYQDPRFIRLAMSIPVRAKIRRGYGKYIVKEAFRHELPPHTLTRRKSSFVPPIVDWILPEYEESLLSSKLFERSEISRRMQQHLGRERDNLSFLWGLLVTNGWIEKYQAQAHVVPTSEKFRHQPRAMSPSRICRSFPTRPAT
jgi:asparagine synthase (glutamine-hydrolysing)